jgi:hypothetical protein
MSFNEILEQLLKLTEDEKRQLWKGGRKRRHGAVNAGR